jgi:GT2 family glycosyltransferase
MKFGCFIITYNRPDILPSTVDVIRRQTLPPAHILVIDNSEMETARAVVDAMGDATITYEAMGENKGPAGGAYAGLKWFKEHGYDWVYWGDDDNPPGLPDTFERIFEMIAATKNVGVAAAVGQKFNFKNGTIARLRDDALSGILDVDVMAGGGCMVVNMNCITDQTLPDPALFFGFEELDFCFRMKAAGFRLVVDGDLMKRVREKWGRLGDMPKQASLRSSDTLWREYYSTRNLIYIFSYRFPDLRGLAYRKIFTSLVKAIAGFSRGWDYGWRLCKIEWSAISDGIFKKMYKKSG